LTLRAFSTKVLSTDQATTRLNLSNSPPLTGPKNGASTEDHAMTDPAQTRLYRVRVNFEYMAWADSPDQANYFMDEALADSLDHQPSVFTRPFVSGERLPYQWTPDTLVYNADDEDLTVAAALARITTQEIAP
jgi:hypothetical protein